MLCLKDKFFTYLKDSDIKFNLMLLSCAWCDAKNKVVGVKHEFTIASLFILPIYVITSCMSYNNVTCKMDMILSLDNYQKTFKNDSSFDKEAIEFIKEFDTFQQEPLNIELEKLLYQQFRNISEYSYLEILKRIIHAEEYELATYIVANFFRINVRIRKQGFRTFMYYRVSEANERKDALFYDVGVSLDEGQVQLMTQMVTGCSDEYISSYYLEMSFVKKMHLKYSEKIMFRSHYNKSPARFLYQLTKESENNCDFFNLLKFTHDQDWRSAIKLLNRLPNVDEDNFI